MAQQQQRYKVLEKIASGGMAEVFRAESAGLEGFKKTVAIKRVLPHLSEKRQFIGMFLDEARVCAHLSHSNCVQVFDIGVGDNAYFIVMEYVDGADLKQVIEHRKKTGIPFPTEEACLICVRICEGLSYAHELRDSRNQPLNIVHRDMSPPNVLITRFGEVKIVDFGLARANSQLEKSEPGIIKGKFSYLSPEAAQGKPVDARTDIFAVGIILWELLAGRRLFMGDSDLETVRLVQRAVVPPIRQFNPTIAPEVEAIVSRALTQDPRERYQTAREFGHDLNNALFRMGRAVASFDIARLVEPVRADREAKAQKKKGYDRRSIIGTLIEETLFEFQSLEEQQQQVDGHDDRVEQGSAPLNFDTFERMDDWSRELSGASLEPRREPPTGPGPRSIEPYNLAALEEDSLSAGRLSVDSQAPSAQPPPPPAAHRMTIPDPEPLDSTKSGPGLRGVLVVLLALLVLGVAVYMVGFAG